jgi:hypothetical protein
MREKTINTKRAGYTRDIDHIIKRYCTLEKKKDSGIKKPV